MNDGGPGRIVILNGTPRAGKSSIVAAIQATFDGPWLNLGVDVLNQHVTPERYRPGIGLRPGGERPDLEPFIVAQYAALYESVAAHSRQGLNVVVDVGHHDSYSRPLGILQDSARRLRGLPALFVGVRCPIEVVMQRRNAGQSGREGTYLTGPPHQPPGPVLLWQSAVHTPGIYDMDVDTSLLSPEQCAAHILQRLRAGPPPSALARLAAERSA
jgi:chloramphenicol 3-O phosphotransferase